MASRSACSRAGARPMRASSTRRGALPARKPGQADLLGDLAERLVDVAVELGSSIVTESLTLLPSRVCSELFTGAEASEPRSALDRA